MAKEDDQGVTMIQIEQVQHSICKCLHPVSQLLLATEKEMFSFFENYLCSTNNVKQIHWFLENQSE